MFAKIVILIAIAGAAAALPAHDGCDGKTYRCDSNNKNVEVCTPQIGWRLQSACAGPTCAYDSVQGVPHCYDY